MDRHAPSAADARRPPNTGHARIAGVAMIASVASIVVALGASRLAAAPPPVRPPASGPVATPVPFEALGQFGGDTFAVAVGEGRLYAGVGPRVAVLDVSDPAVPTPLGLTARLPGVVVDLAVDGNTVYAIAGGLAAIDVSDPTAPAQIGFLALGEIDPVYGWIGPADIAVADGVAFLAGNTDYGFGRLNLVDVSDPSDPRLVSRLEVYTTIGVAAAGARAFVSLRSCFGPDCTPDHVAMLVVDASDPAAPRVIGDYAAEEGAGHVALAGDRVLLTDSTCRLTLIDVSDPTNPRQSGCLGLSTSGTTAGIAADDDHAYVIDPAGALFIVDLRGAGAPRVVGTTSVWTRGVVRGSGVDAAGGRAYIAGAMAGVAVLDVASPTAPRWLGGHRWPTQFVDGALDGHLAYVAGSASGLHVLDLSDPAAIRQVGALATGDGAFRVVRSGDKVHLLAEQSSEPRAPATSLRTIDVSDPASPRETDRRDINGLIDLSLDGTRLYASAANVLSIFDVGADPARPALLGQLAAPTGRRHGLIAVQGDRLYVITSAGGGAGGREAPMLRVVDVSSASSPRPLADVIVGDNQSAITGLDTAGDHVLLARARAQQEMAGLVVIDVRAPAAPSVVGEWTSSIEDVAPSGVRASGRWAYLSTWAGVRALDVVVPGYPADVARWTSPEWGTYTRLAVVEPGDGRLVLPRGDAGLLVLGVDLPEPATPTAGPSPTRTPTGPPRPSLTPSGSETPTRDTAPGPTRRPTVTTGPSRTPTPYGTPPPTPLPSRTAVRTPGWRMTATAESRTATPFGTAPLTITPIDTAVATPTRVVSATPSGIETPVVQPTAGSATPPAPGTASSVPPTATPATRAPSPTGTPSARPTEGPSPTGSWWSSRIYLPSLIRQRWG